MNYKNTNINTIYCVIILLIVFYCIRFVNEIPNKAIKTSLEKDGYIVFSTSSKHNPLNSLPKNYAFIDYEYSIRGCTLSTFHRDVTSSQYEYKTSHPVYTFITYKNKGDLLSVCEGSHKTTPYLYSSPKTISGNENTSILFNCDLVHAGALSNLGKMRHAIQYKIAHKDDMKKLKHLVGIKKEKRGNCDNTQSKSMAVRNCSLLFSHVVNHIFTPYLQKNQHDILNDIVIKVSGTNFYNK